MDYQAVRHEFELESDLYRYQTLQQWLKYETIALVVWIGAFFAPIEPIAYVAALAALAFVPVMVKELVPLKQFTWIAIWAAVTLVPTALIYFVGPENAKLFWAAVGFSVASYVYFWSLSRATNKWARQQASQLELTKRKAAEKAKIESELKFADDDGEMDF